MKKLFVIAPAVVYVCAAWGASLIPGNAERGAQVFDAKACGACHALNGKGGNGAPDLAKSPRGRFTPALLAAEMWNHGPEMWDRLKGEGKGVPTLTRQEAADLFAYLYTFRHPEEQGDPERGREIFEAKGCASCHAGAGTAPPVSQWGSIHDPIELARVMWNHADHMAEAVQKKKEEWPRLTGQELADVVAYVRGEPGAAEGAVKLTVASAETGEMLFRERGCTECHTGPQSLAGKSAARTLTDLAAAMWNHVPEMGGRTRNLRPEEITRLVGYLWSIQYFDEAGDPASGMKAALESGCVSCHGQLPAAGARRFTALAGELDAIGFLASVWNHGEEMRSAMDVNGKPWPKLDRTTVNNLLAYIASLR